MPLRALHATIPLCALHATMPTRARGLSEADRATWATYARMIAPLPGRTPGSFPDPPSLASKPHAVSAPPPSQAPAARPPRPIADPLAVGGQPGGLDKATWQRLRSGKLATERTLDLHGQTVQRAYHALVSFLRAAHADRVRCVEIITGRGNGETGGVIRRELPHWLNQPDIRPLVLGAAHPHALNPGSVRLLLRRVR
jgi:DNA-nicking Smr family endonuclease